MTLKSSATFFKFASVALFSVSFALGIKYYNGQKQYKKLKETSKIDKETYANDIREILTRYDNEVKKYNELKTIKTEIAKKTTTTLEVPNNNTISEKTEKSISKEYNKKIDSFKNIIKDKEKTEKNLEAYISELNQKNKELLRINKDNEKIISVSKNLTAVNVVANGVKITANNIIETRRFNSTQQIKVCFTLLENKAAIKGNKDLYIQIINPKNKVVAKNGETVESNDRLLRFSAKTNVYYDNEDLDVCVFVDPNKQDLTKGDYEINIYSGITLIGNTVFSLR